MHKMLKKKKIYKRNYIYYNNSLIQGKTKQNKNNAVLISRNYLYLNIFHFI